MTVNIFEKIKIVFEDEDILAIDKPAGLVVHSDERTEEPSLSDWLEEKYPDLKDIGRPHTLDNERYAPRYGMLHRIDRDTSGVLLIAKNIETFDYIHAQFLENKIEKEYIALVEGVVKEDGVINIPIGRSKVDPRKWTSGADIRNTKREAVTEYKVIEIKNNKTLLQVFPKTGRTHQIRVHLLFLGYPIIGDKRYNEKSVATRMFLHAKSISFLNKNGEMVKYETEIPKEFLDF